LSKINKITQNLIYGLKTEKISTIHAVESGLNYNCIYLNCKSKLIAEQLQQTLENKKAELEKQLMEFQL
jgi:hypothetical protein